MSWLDEALDLRNCDLYYYDFVRRSLGDIEDKTQEADLMEYASEMARCTIRAAREHLVFVKTKEGQVGIANARIVDGDLICQLQGCSELVILCEVHEGLAMGDHHRRHHEFVGRVHLTGWRGSGRSRKDFPTDSSIDIFEII
jgi:hypothetical protein